MRTTARANPRDSTNARDATKASQRVEETITNISDILIRELEWKIFAEERSIKAIGEYQDWYHKVRGQDEKRICMSYNWYQKCWANLGEELKEHIRHFIGCLS